MENTTLPTENRTHVIERDDLLGKNKYRRSGNGDAPEGPFHGQPPYRKRTEDLGDSL
jgi:hypothetical protein